MRITEKKLFMFYKLLLREGDMKFSFGWNQAFIDIGSVNTTGNYNVSFGTEDDITRHSEMDLMTMVKMRDNLSEKIKIAEQINYQHKNELTIDSFIVLNVMLKDFQEEMILTEKLYKGAMEVIKLIPKCEVHGNTCLPNAKEWVMRMKGEL